LIKDHFDQLGGFLLGEANLLVNLFNDVGLGHGGTAGVVARHSLPLTGVFQSLQLKG
jgi:hypothetical protein